MFFSWTWTFTTRSFSTFDNFLLFLYIAQCFANSWTAATNWFNFFLLLFYYFLCPLCILQLRWKTIWYLLCLLTFVSFQTFHLTFSVVFLVRGWVL
uniref:Uncharacterized protein n=1 Tax=Panstrongylus lignarius TaxID=156445 RepID=A0A224XR51_9HEMI